MRRGSSTCAIAISRCDCCLDEALLLLRECRVPSDKRSIPIDATVDHAHAVTDAQLSLTELIQRYGAARIQPDDRAVTIAFVRLLDLIPDDRAADRARDSRRRVAAAAAELMADDTAGDAAEDR